MNNNHNGQIAIHAAQDFNLGDAVYLDLENNCIKIYDREYILSNPDNLNFSKTVYAICHETICKNDLVQISRDPRSSMASVTLLTQNQADTNSEIYLDKAISMVFKRPKHYGYSGYTKPDGTAQILNAEEFKELYLIVNKVMNNMMDNMES